MPQQKAKALKKKALKNINSLKNQMRQMTLNDLKH
jgi:hypothetical protein